MPVTFTTLNPGPSVAPVANFDILRSLISFWNLQEDSGVRYDAYVKNYPFDGVINNPLSGSGPSSLIPNAASFITTSLQSLTNLSSLNSDLEIGDFDWTYTVWAYANSFPASNVNSDIIISKSGDGGLGFGLEIITGDKRIEPYLTNTLGAAVTPVNGIMAVNQWYFFTVYFDNTRKQFGIQVNNNQAVEAAFSGTVQTGSYLRVGMRNLATAEGWWDGRIAGLGFWKRLLTDQEKAYLYNDGNGVLFLPLPAQEAPFSLIRPNFASLYTFNKVKAPFRQFTNITDLTPPELDPTTIPPAPSEPQIVWYPKLLPKSLISAPLPEVFPEEVFDPKLVPPILTEVGLQGYKLLQPKSITEISPPAARPVDVFDPTQTPPPVVFPVFLKPAKITQPEPQLFVDIADIPDPNLFNPTNQPPPAVWPVEVQGYIKQILHGWSGQPNPVLFDVFDPTQTVPLKAPTPWPIQAHVVQAAAWKPYIDIIEVAPPPLDPLTIPPQQAYQPILRRAIFISGQAKQPPPQAALPEEVFDPRLRPPLDINHPFWRLARLIKPTSQGFVTENTLIVTQAPQNPSLYIPHINPPKPKVILKVAYNLTSSIIPTQFDPVLLPHTAASYPNLLAWRFWAKSPLGLWYVIDTGPVPIITYIPDFPGGNARFNP